MFSRYCYFKWNIPYIQVTLEVCLIISTYFFMLGNGILWTYYPQSGMHQIKPKEYCVIDSFNSVSLLYQYALYKSIYIYLVYYFIYLYHHNEAYLSDSNHVRSLEMKSRFFVPKIRRARVVGLINCTNLCGSYYSICRFRCMYCRS